MRSAGQAPHRLLWARWVLANAIGELLGLGSTFAIGAGLFSGLANAPGSGAVLLTAGVMTATGAFEGVVVGLLQWAVLRSVLTGISRRTWVVATVVGAVVAWFCGAISMTLASLSADATAAAAAEPPLAVTLLLAAGLGLVAGLVLSTAQWAVLRRHVTGAWWWLPANALAWAAGMPLIFAGVDLAQRAGSVLVGILSMAAAIAIAGAVVGAIHGRVLAALVAVRTK